MSLLFQKRDLGDTVNQLVPLRPLGTGGGVPVTLDSALRHSAVWACLRLRANLISTMPINSYRLVGGIQIDVPDSPFIDSPGGEDQPRHEWIQASQVDIDRAGNSFGVIRKVDAAGKPAQVDLVPYSEVSCRVKGGRIVSAKVGGEDLDLKYLWHERGFVLPGIPIGLSTIAYAAMSIGGYLSAQQFALDWFATGAHPAGHLKNTEQDGLSTDVIQVAKERFKASAQNRDIFVSGMEWEYTPAAADAAQAAFLDEMRYGIADICRFFDVPGDMIGAETSSGSVTYANITQRNLQLLIMHLGPAVIRREQILSAQIAKPRFVKFDTDSLLRMDPMTVTQMLAARIAARLETPSEARGQINLPPLTEADCLEFDRLFPPKPGSGTAPAGSVPLELDLPTEA